MAWIYLLAVLEARAMESVCLPGLHPPEIPKRASVSNLCSISNAVGNLQHAGSAFHSHDETPEVIN